MDAIRLLIEAQNDLGIPCIVTINGEQKKYTLSSPHELEVFWERPEVLGLNFDWLEIPDSELQELAAQCFSAEGLNKYPDGKDFIALRMSCTALTAIWLLSIVMN